MCKKVYAHTSYKARLRPLQRNGVPCVTAALNKIPCCILHTYSSCMCGYVLSSKVLKHRYASVTVSCSDPHQPALMFDVSELSDSFSAVLRCYRLLHGYSLAALTEQRKVGPQYLTGRTIYA